MSSIPRFLKRIKIFRSNSVFLKSPLFIRRFRWLQSNFLNDSQFPYLELRRRGRFDNFECRAAKELSSVGSNLNPPLPWRYRFFLAIPAIPGVTAALHGKPNGASLHPSAYRLIVVEPSVNNLRIDIRRCKN